MHLILASFSEAAGTLCPDPAMKAINGVGLATVVLTIVADAVTYGPGNCVTLSRSSRGSCVITTDCDGQNISKFDFSLKCEKKSGVEIHSFGVGSFDDQEEYDTEVQCDKCSSPVKQKTKLSLWQAGNIDRRERAVTTGRKMKRTRMWPDMWFDGESDTTSTGTVESMRYGPGKCVSTWRSKDGNCIVQTAGCSESDVETYNMGFICVDEYGAPTRHLFGRDSFDGSETFDTEIKCTKCMGLDDVQPFTNTFGMISVLRNEVGELATEVESVSTDVQKLNAKVHPTSVPTTNAKSAFVHLDRRVKPSLISRRHRAHVLRHTDEDVDNTEEESDDAEQEHAQLRRARHDDQYDDGETDGHYDDNSDAQAQADETQERTDGAEQQDGDNVEASDEAADRSYSEDDSPS